MRLKICWLVLACLSTSSAATAQESPGAGFGGKETFDQWQLDDFLKLNIDITNKYDSYYTDSDIGASPVLAPSATDGADEWHKWLVESNSALTRFADTDTQLVGKRDELVSDIVVLAEKMVDTGTWEGSSLQKMYGPMLHARYADRFPVSEGEIESIKSALWSGGFTDSSDTLKYVIKNPTLEEADLFLAGLKANMPMAAAPSFNCTMVPNCTMDGAPSGANSVGLMVGADSIVAAADGLVSVALDPVRVGVNGALLHKSCQGFML